MVDQPTQQAAVFIDGSALFFAIRDLSPESNLDYRGLVDILCREFGISSGVPVDGPKAKLLTVPEPSGRSQASPWIFWTAASGHNEGQLKFLAFVEEKLRITVRRFSPGDSLTVDPQALLAASSAPHLKDRATRFDSSIAYMIGRLADTHQVIVVSDSFALAEPMVRAMRSRWERYGQSPQPPNVLAFFGRSLDSRWRSILEAGTFGDPNGGVLRFFDLDKHSEQLFGTRREVERSWWGADVPTGASFPPPQSLRNPR